MPWVDPPTGRPIPRPSAADRLPRRRSQVRTLRTPAETRAALVRQAELRSLRQLHDAITTDPADLVATAVEVLGPARTAERAAVHAELCTAMDAVKLHRDVLPGQAVPGPVVNRFARAWRASRRLDARDREERTVITNGMSAKLARKREAQRRRAAAAMRSRRQREALVASAWPRLTSDDPSIVTGVLW